MSQSDQQQVLQALALVLAERKHASPESSYVASLHHKGLNTILKKIGEECAETIVAAKDAERDGKLDDVIHETADLWFHSLVMLSHLGGHPDQILAELARRFGLSGHDEKAGRRAS